MLVQPLVILQLVLFVPVLVALDLCRSRTSQTAVSPLSLAFIKVNQYLVHTFFKASNTSTWHHGGEVVIAVTSQRRLRIAS